MPHPGGSRAVQARQVLGAFLGRAVAEDTLYLAAASVRRLGRNEAVPRFVDAWRQLPGQLPGELVFDFRLTAYAVLAQLQDLGIRFLTLRRRSARTVRELIAAGFREGRPAGPRLGGKRLRLVIGREQPQPSHAKT